MRRVIVESPTTIDRISWERRDDGPLFAERPPQLPGCPHWPGCGCGTQSGPHTCEWRAQERDKLNSGRKIGRAHV